MATGFVRHLRDAFSFGDLVFVHTATACLLILPACRDFSRRQVTNEPASAGTAGTENLAGTGGMDGGAGGEAGMRDDPGGAGGTLAGAGAGGVADGGTNGGGEGSSTTAAPGIHGAVRLLIDGQPVCGGTLRTNFWVLTADRCVPEGVAASSLSVGYGLDSNDFQQLRRVVEIQRFPGNDGSDDQRTRDLLLLGVDAPFWIDGSPSAHVTPLWPSGTEELVRVHRCVGWDLDPDPTSASHELRTVSLQAVAADAQGLWWLNSNPFAPADGNLPMSADTGIGCFVGYGATSFQTAVHSYTPANVERAHAASLSDGVVHDWLEQLLWEEPTRVETILEGPAAACSFGPDSLELFALSGGLSIQWFSATNPGSGDSWALSSSVAAPEDVVFARTRPAVVCNSSGDVELFATDVGGAVWWRRWLASSGAWGEAWELVPGTPEVSSGIAAAGAWPGRFQLFVSNLENVVEHAAYDADAEGWGPWRSTHQEVVGAPAARMSHSGALDLVVWRAYNGALGWLSSRAGSVLLNRRDLGPTASAPALASFGERLDAFVRSESSQLARYWFDDLWIERPVDTGMTLPPGELTAVSRQPGSLDVFVAEPGQPLWHARWPRRPKAGGTAP